MKFESEFEWFLENVVNLSPGRLKTLRERTAAIEKVLRSSSDPKLRILDARPQGSLAQKTIINPSDAKRGFDADLLVECGDGFAGPRDLLDTIEKALRESARHANLVRQKTRCVTLEYAGEFHIDVVPCVKLDGVLHIGNNETNQWEETDPDGYSKWLGERDAHANGYLVPAIRFCKYLRDYKGRPAIKSVILTTLLADRATARGSHEYTDLPTTLVILLEELASWCRQFPTAPELQEPTCSSELRLDETNWPACTKQIESLARRSRDAYDEQGQEKSLALWRDLFGKRFPSPERRLVEAALAPGEQDLYRDLGIPTMLSERVVIDGRVRPKSGFRAGSITELSPLQKHRSLVFELASTTVEPPFDVYWKVKNTGEEATRLGALRGEITPDHGGIKAMKTESTLYTGRHYVEVYIVKDDICVAKARQEVPIV